MTNNRSAVVNWINRFNAELALYNAQVSATQVEHNARYVNNAGTGPLWSAQDATDVAALAAMTTDRNNQAAALATMTTNYNNEVAAYNAQVAATAAATAAALDHLAATGTSPGDNGQRTVANLTADRTGQWIVLWGSLNNRADFVAVFGYVAGGLIRGAGMNAVDTVTPLYAYWQGSVSAGTVFRLDVNGRGGGTVTGFMDAYFIPTPANPH